MLHGDLIFWLACGLCGAFGGASVAILTKMLRKRAQKARRARWDAYIQILSSKLASIEAKINQAEAKLSGDS